MYIRALKPDEQAGIEAGFSLLECLYPVPLSLAQIDGNMRKSEEFLQRGTYELSEGRGRLQGDGAKSSLPVKGEHAANLKEIPKHAFDPVLPQVARQLRSATAEPTPRPDQQIVGQVPRSIKRR